MSGTGWEPVDDTAPDPWTPIAHEDAAEAAAAPAAKPVRPKHEPETRASKKKATEATPATPAMSLAFIFPPEMAAMMTALAEGQTVLTAEIAGMKTALGDFAAEMTDALETLTTALGDMKAADEEASATRVEMLEHMHTQAGGQSTAHGELVASVAALTENLKGWTAAIVAAVTAPRRVSLERDKDGNAVAAVSKTGEA